MHCLNSQTRFLCLATCLGLSLSATGVTLREAAESLLPKLGQPNPPGKVLLEEDFESGSLDRWQADQGWSVVDRPNGEGRCARVVSSEKEHEDLILKERIPVVPGHPIVIYWKVRYESGGSPLYLRVDFFDETGQQGEPYARQETSREERTWSENALLVSDWFPPYTRAITVHFHHQPNAATTSLLDDLRVIDLDAAAKEVVARELPGYVEKAKKLERDLGDLPKSPVNNAWKILVAARLPEIRRQLEASASFEAGSSEQQQTLEAPARLLTRFIDAVAALKQRKIAVQGLLTYSTTPITSTMILPRSSDLPGVITNEVATTLCPGERAPASLVLWSPASLRSLTLKVSDLKGSGGTIAASNVDLRYVKCWYQGGSAPHGIATDRTRKSLVPELLLNDDSLVKVDLDSQHNSLKLSFPDGPKYVPIDDPTPPAQTWGHRYKAEEFPVKDSPVLLPLDLAAGENKQVWITVKVPDTAKSGRYTGRISLSVSGKKLGEVTLAVQVLPFKLESPRTHHDPQQDFTYSLYYWGELDSTGVGVINYKYKTEQQFRAELRMMYDHGIVAPTMIWSPTVVYENESLFRRHLALAREVGMAGRPLYFGDSSLIGNPTESAPLEQLKMNVRRTIEVAREYGFPEVYFYGIDEATEDRLKSQRVAWQVVHEAGGKVIVSGFHGQFEAMGDLLDLCNWAGSPAGEQPERWHKLGHKLWNYGNPQTPVEDPAVYRRNYGLDLWKSDFDGACTYCFMDSSGTQWNDFDDNTYRDHNVAYPTVDGVVGTLALEGFREGVEDVKYATTLCKAIERAVASGIPERRDKALKAKAWLKGLDTRSADLDEVRRKMISCLLELRS